MSKHTPGPWQLRIGKTCSNEVTAQSKRGKTWVIARTTGAKVGREQDDANANLIAAAPDMLHALEYIVNHCRVFCDESMDIDGMATEDAINALKKAKGEA
jgi:hypothetical protein